MPRFVSLPVGYMDILGKIFRSVITPAAKMMTVP